MSLTKISRNLILINRNKSTTFLLNPNINPNVIALHSLLPKTLKYSTLSKYNYPQICPNNNQQHYRKNIPTYVRQLFTSMVRSNEMDSSSGGGGGGLENNIASTEEKYQELKQKISELGHKNLNSIVNLAVNEKYNELKNNENWSRLIVDFVEQKEIKIALKLFDKMKSLSLIPNQEAFTAMLRGLSEKFVSEEPVKHLRTIVDLMDAKSKTSPEFKLETEHINYLLKTCQKLGNLNTAYGSYDKYIKSGNVKPDKSTYLYLLKTSFGSAESNPKLAYKLANEIWEGLNKRIDVQIEENNDYVPIDNDLVYYILETYKGTSHVKDALIIADHTYGIGKSQSSSESSTPPLNLPIEHAPLNTILNMCINGKQFLLGLKYYDQTIKKYPDLEHDINLYNNLMTLYNSTFQFDKTIELFNDKIKDTDLKPNKMTLEVMMLACHNLRDLDSVKYFYENYSEKELDLEEPDIMGLIKLALKRARIDGGPDDVVWLLNKLDEIDPNKEENEKYSQLKNISHLSYLSTISMAYEIALALEDLPEGKRAQWQKDKVFFEERFTEISDNTEKATQERINNTKPPGFSFRDKVNKTYQMSVFSAPPSPLPQRQPNMEYNVQFSEHYIPSNMNYYPRAHSNGRDRPFASTSPPSQQQGYLPSQQQYRQSYITYHPSSYNDRGYNRPFASPQPQTPPHYPPSQPPPQQYYNRNGGYNEQSNNSYNLSAYNKDRGDIPSPSPPSYQQRYNNNRRPVGQRPYRQS